MSATNGETPRYCRYQPLPVKHAWQFSTPLQNGVSMALPPSSSVAQLSSPVGQKIGAGVTTVSSDQPAAGYDQAKVLAKLNANAKAHSEHHCSYFVAVAINAGLPDGAKKLVVDHGKKWGPANGGVMGPKLVGVGFTEVTVKDYVAQSGDVAVIANGQAGHVAMYNGKEWVSDFRQGVGKGPNPYKDKTLAVRYFRHP